mgnify:CR=1 FL=1
MLVGYARVSTFDQDSALQVDALRTAGCERIFTEKISGAVAARPQFEAALALLRPDDVLVVWRLDRLARSLRQLIDVVDELAVRKVGLVSVTETIDTTSPAGKLIFHLFAALSEFERALIRERTNAGLASARARGRKGGRPPALTDRDVTIARAMLADPCITVSEAAAKLGVSTATLYRHLGGGGRGAISSEANMDTS